jgi:hypothetical protein
MADPEVASSQANVLHREVSCRFAVHESIAVNNVTSKITELTVLCNDSQTKQGKPVSCSVC